jgi:hypothetical protein
MVTEPLPQVFLLLSVTDSTSDLHVYLLLLAYPRKQDFVYDLAHISQSKTKVLAV